MQLRLQGLLLFLFIPLVLFLFLKYPFGVLPSFATAVAIMLGHRWIARPFFLRNSSRRCFWCGSTKHSRTTISIRVSQRLPLMKGEVRRGLEKFRTYFQPPPYPLLHKEGESTSGTSIGIQLCLRRCSGRARRFFDFCYRYRIPLRIGIFLTLAWYVATMILNDLGIIHFPVEWNRFLFQFVIAITVVIISFAYTSGHKIAQPVFPFPIHNLFLIGAKNTLLVFRYVGFWWLATSLYFLFVRFRG